VSSAPKPAPPPEVPRAHFTAGTLVGFALPALVLFVGTVLIAAQVRFGWLTVLTLGLVGAAALAVPPAIAHVNRRLIGAPPPLPLRAGETARFEGVADRGLGRLYRGVYIPATAGRLTLTDRRLAFRPAGGKDGIDLALADVADVQAGRHAGLVPVDLVLTLQNGSRKTFKVVGHRAWADEIRLALVLRDT